MNKNKGTQIIVLGAGYAGMMAALRLAGKTRHLDVQVRLVNIAPDFVQRPRLHHLAVGRDVPQVPIAHMLRSTRVEFLQGWVSGIDLEARKVELQSESASMPTCSTPMARMARLRCARSSSHWRTVSGCW